jgi:hypothetical protein
MIGVREYLKIVEKLAAESSVIQIDNPPEAVSLASAAQAFANIFIQDANKMGEDELTKMLMIFCAGWYASKMYGRNVATVVAHVSEEELGSEAVQNHMQGPLGQKMLDDLDALAENTVKKIAQRKEKSGRRDILESIVSLDD